MSVASIVDPSIPEEQQRRPSALRDTAPVMRTKRAGIRVKRGPDWKYDDQDGGPRGRGTTSADEDLPHNARAASMKDEDSDDEALWTCVRWESV